MADFRVLMVDSRKESWSASDPNPPHLNSTSVEQWVHCFNGVHIGGATTPSFDPTQFDLVIANLNKQHWPSFARQLKQRKGTTKWIALVEWDVSMYADPTEELLTILRNCDLVATINRHTTDYFDWLSGGKARWVGVPYPVDRIARFRSAFDERSKKALCTMRSPQGYSVAAISAAGCSAVVPIPAVGRSLSNWREFAAAGRIAKDIRIDEASNVYDGVDAEFLIAPNDEAWYEFAARFSLWVNLDPRFTWARSVLDAAALEVPIVSTSSTDHASELFPALTVTHACQTGEAAALIRKAMENPEWAHQQAVVARKKLESEYSKVAAMDRLIGALESVGKLIPALHELRGRLTE